MAIRASGEYADEDSADQMAEALLQLLRDNHQRVRFAAFFALGQLCHDRSSNFHERWCDKFMPVLMQGCNDTNVIAVKAISALEAHFHGLSEDDIRRFSDMLIPILMQKLQSTDPKIIIASLEAIGALAISLDDGFDSCYDALVPLLLRALTGEAEKNIREKAFECISFDGFRREQGEIRTRSSYRLEFHVCKYKDESICPIAIMMPSNGFAKCWERTSQFSCLILCLQFYKLWNLMMSSARIFREKMKMI